MDYHGYHIRKSATEYIVRWGSEIPSITNLLFDSGTLLAPVDHSTSYSALTLPSTSHLPCYGNPLGPSGSLFLLRSELERLHDRLHRLEFGDAAAFTGGTPGAPTGMVLAGALPLQLQPLPLLSSLSATPPYHLPKPSLLLRTHRSATPVRLWCLTQLSGISLAVVLRAYTDKASPLKHRVSIRGTDQQVGEALIALGQRFMRKRIRSKKNGPSRPSGDLAPPPPSPALVSLDVSSEGACPLKKRAHPPYLPLAPASVRPPPAASAQLRPAGAAIRPRKSGVRFAPQESSYPASHFLPHIPATTSIPTQLLRPWPLTLFDLKGDVDNRRHGEAVQILKDRSFYWALVFVGAMNLEEGVLRKKKKVGGKNGCCCEAGECGGQKSSPGEREDGTDGDVSGRMRKGYGNGFEMQQYDGQEDHRQVEGAKLNMMGVSWHGQMKCIEKHMT
ncbi:hypothetical protein R3P38DRAFT_3361731 [Favolaschia claudopus]|uniref:K Homology domain-containing protein n=1 Tax=Favolaschia claudopus TaxID=2862362 RepID=A0AAW0ATX5_9AGAR